jgi:glucose-1-phosphate adenylyltransferase
VILPEVNIGRYVKLKKVVIDRDCDIPPSLVVGEDPVEDARRFYRSEGGVTLITKEMLARLR